MISEKCKKCGKVIEGYSKSHVEWMMQQHLFKHIREEKEKEIKEYKR